MMGHKYLSTTALLAFLVKEYLYKKCVNNF